MRAGAFHLPHTMRASSPHQHIDVCIQTYTIHISPRSIYTTIYILCLRPLYMGWGGNTRENHKGNARRGRCAQMEMENGK